MKEEIKIKYKIIDKIKESNNVFTLKMIPINKKINKEISYIPGQFINIYFPDLNTPEGKAYSISSHNNEKTINITVKGMGLFSNKLISMKIGESIYASIPYGYFYSENESEYTILIAAGIGIAPFRSMIYKLNENKNNKIIIYYSIRKIDEIIFKKEFDNLIINNKNIEINYFITKENRESLEDKLNNNSEINIIENKKSSKKYKKDVNTKYNYNRIPIDKIKLIKNAEYFICGSIEFVSTFWKGLKNKGIEDDKLYTEAFFSH